MMREINIRVAHGFIHRERVSCQEMEENQVARDESRTPESIRPWLFKPGQSGNPSGKPVGSIGLARYIRESSMHGKELADFMFGVMRGEERFSKCADRITACKWLADRAFGAVEMEGDDKPRIDWSRITDEEFAFLAGLRERLASIAERCSTPQGPEGVGTPPIVAP